MTDAELHALAAQCDRVVRAAPLNRRLLAAVEMMPANSPARHMLPAHEREQLQRIYTESMRP